jgi:hypothetical protein
MLLFVAGIVCGWVLLGIGFLIYLWAFVDDTIDPSYYAQVKRLKAEGKQVS